MAEMRLREGDQHAGVISCFEDFFKTEVVTGLAAVIVSVDEVDAETFETLKTFAGAGVGGKCRADLGIIKGHSGKEKARAIKIEIAPVNPELPKTKSNRPGRVEDRAGGIDQG